MLGELLAGVEGEEGDDLAHARFFASMLSEAFANLTGVDVGWAERKASNDKAGDGREVEARSSNAASQARPQPEEAAQPAPQGVEVGEGSQASRQAAPSPAPSPIERGLGDNDSWTGPDTPVAPVERPSEAIEQLARYHVVDTAGFNEIIAYISRLERRERELVEGLLSLASNTFASRARGVHGDVFLETHFQPNGARALRLLAKCGAVTLERDDTDHVTARVPAAALVAAQKNTARASERSASLGNSSDFQVAPTAPEAIRSGLNTGAVPQRDESREASGSAHTLAAGGKSATTESHSATREATAPSPTPAQEAMPACKLCGALPVWVSDRGVICETATCRMSLVDDFPPEQWLKLHSPAVADRELEEASRDLARFIDAAPGAERLFEKLGKLDQVHFADRLRDWHTAYRASQRRASQPTLRQEGERG